MDKLYLLIFAENVLQCLMFTKSFHAHVHDNKIVVYIVSILCMKINNCNKSVPSVFKQEAEAEMAAVLMMLCRDILNNMFTLPVPSEYLCLKTYEYYVQRSPIKLDFWRTLVHFSHLCLWYGVDGGLNALIPPGKKGAEPLHFTQVDEERTVGAIYSIEGVAGV